ncbi:MAG: S8 family serine peptidase [Acidobacteriota bacterium]
MNKTKYILWIIPLLLVFASGFSAQSRAVQNSYVEGELLVRFKKNAPLHQISLAHSQLGAEVIKEFPLTGWQRVRLPEGMSVGDGLSLYKNSDSVLEAQPNYIYHVLATPNDPRYGELYGMTKIQAPVAWNTTTGSANVVVAIIDTGVLYTHEDLAPNMWRNPGEIPGNNLDDDNNGYRDDVHGIDVANRDSDPLDDFDHGTHVAGIIGAAGNNSLGIAGVNWSVSIMAVKLHNVNGSATSAGAVECFQYVTMMKNRGVNIRVTNNSWGGAPEAAGYDQALKDAIDAAGNAGILNVFAAGNSNSNNDLAPFYPASYNSPSILAVASSTDLDSRSGFSNYGAAGVDVAAPGSSILSAIIYQPGYGYKSGTSMASPHAAGAAALVAASNPQLSNLSLKATLINTVDALPQWTGVVRSGGRLNVARAISTPTVCNFTLDHMSRSFGANGGTDTVNITAATSCDWAVVSNAGWIDITSFDVGSGNGAVSYTVEPNTSSAPRAGTITIAGKTFNVSQSGSSVCSYSLNPLSRNFSASGGAGSVGVTAPSGCAWTAVSNDSWINVTGGASGSGDGSVSYSVSVNSSSVTRTGSITIAGQTHSVTQSGASACSFSLAPTSASFAASGGAGSVGVTAPSGCAWTAASNASFITITAGASGAGSGTVNYTVSTNNSSSIRTGTLSIAGQTFTVTQAASSCVSTISPQSRAFGSTGGTGYFTVSAISTCNWAAQSGSAWITITAGANGPGPKTLKYSVAANPSTSSRSGVIIIGKFQHTVTQSGATCGYSISPASQPFSSGGGSGSVGVTAAAGCSWTAVSNAAFITITAGASGAGSGTVNFNVAANTSSSSRSGTVTIAGQTFTVTQSGAGGGCSFGIAPTSQNFASAGGLGTVNVTASSGCAWTAVSNAAFITITGGYGGSGSGVVSFSVAANASSSRSGTMTIAGQTFTVTQNGGVTCAYTIDPINRQLGRAGGSGTVTVTTSAGCAWTAVSNVGWITLTGSVAGSGNGAVSYTVLVNTSGKARTGTVTIAGKTLTIKQSAF